MKGTNAATAHTTTSSGVGALVARHPLASFVVLAYAISWSWWVPQAFADATVRPGVGWPTHIPGLAGPLLSAIVVTAMIEGRSGLRRYGASLVKWRIGWWWMIVPATLGAGAVAVLATSSDVTAADVSSYPGIPVGIGAVLIVLIVLVVNGLGEEGGWRGFVVPRLLQRYSLTTTSLLVAVMWAPWHLPVFFINESFAEFSLGQVVGWTIGLTAGSFLLTWMMRGSNGSVLLVAVWHTAFNFTSATPAGSGAVAATTSTAVMVAAFAIALADRPSRRRKPGDRQRGVGPAPTPHRRNHATSRVKRFFMRAPIGLYRMGLGGLLGKRFLLLEHTGRRSGLRRKTVLEVVEIDGDATPVVVSGFGDRSDWCRNLTANPDVAFTLGRNRVAADARRLDHADGVVVFDRYRIAHPTAARAIGNSIGVSLVDDLNTAAARLPLFRLVPKTE